MKVLLAFVLAAASLAFAAPAGADKPIATENSEMFHAENPCTGLEHLVTINFAVSLHEHGNNFVVTIKRTGTTSDGYTMEHGNETAVGNNGGFHARFRDVWTNDDGSKFNVMGVFGFNDNKQEVVVDKFVIRCLG